MRPSVPYPRRTIEHYCRTVRHSSARPYSLHSLTFTANSTMLEVSMSEQVLKGGCFCGEVQFEVTGQPAAMGYCHCDSCRQWSAGPVNAFSLWNPSALKITRGAGSIGTFNKTPISHRKWCTKCGGHLF